MLHVILVCLTDNIVTVLATLGPHPHRLMTSTRLKQFITIRHRHHRAIHLPDGVFVGSRSRFSQVISQNSVNEWWKKVQRSPVLTTREEGLTFKIEINEGPLHLLQILQYWVGVRPRLNTKYHRTLVTMMRTCYLCQAWEPCSHYYCVQCEMTTGTMHRLMCL